MSCIEISLIKKSTLQKAYFSPVGMANATSLAISHVLGSSQPSSGVVPFEVEISSVTPPQIQKVEFVNAFVKKVNFKTMKPNEIEQTIQGRGYNDKVYEIDATVNHPTYSLPDNFKIIYSET